MRTDTCTVSTNNGSSYVGEYTNKFAYDGWNCIAILNPSLLLSNSFMWGSDLSGSQQRAGGVGGLLKVTYYGTVTTNCFVAYDGNGNVSALIDAAYGATLANYEYGPFGELLRATGPMAKLNPKRFQTATDDDETDLLYYGYRYYNPSTGRWLSRDPAEENGGLNLYGFVNNDAVDYCDMLGLEWIVARNHGARAKVIATSSSDTIGQLASKIGLNPLEYKKWLEPADDPVVSCKVYTIPNQIVLAVGHIPNVTNPIFQDPLKIAENMAQYAEMTLDLKGFLVLYYDRNVNPNLTAAQVEQTVNKNLHGYFFLGHGIVDNITPQFGGGFRFEEDKKRAIYPSDMANGFGYGFGVAYLCSAPFANWGTIMSPYAYFWQGHSLVQWIGADWDAVKAVIDRAQ